MRAVQHPPLQAASQQQHDSHRDSVEGFLRGVQLSSYRKEGAFAGTPVQDALLARI